MPTIYFTNKETQALKLAVHKEIMRQSNSNHTIYHWLLCKIKNSLPEGDDK